MVAFVMRSLWARMLVTVAWLAAGCRFSPSALSGGDGGAVDALAAADAAADAPPGTPDARPADARPVDALTAECGNSALEPPEQCDDGNTEDGDGCSAGDSQFAGSCGGDYSPEAVYALTLYSTYDVSLLSHNAVTSFSDILYVRDTCEDSWQERACWTSDMTLPLQLYSLGPGVYFVFVDGAYGESGSYGIEAVLAPPTCAGFAAALTPGTPAAGTTSSVDRYQPPWSCWGSDGSAGERVYKVNVPAGNDLVATATSTLESFTPLLYVETVCGSDATALDCDDGTYGPASVTVDDAAGWYYLIVDGESGSHGSFDIEAHLRPVLAAGSPCDPLEVDNRCATGLACDYTAGGYVCE